MIQATDYAGISSVWGKYKKTGDVALRNMLVENYLYIVVHIARVLVGKLPDSVEVDDLISAGTFGLFDAIETFDLKRGLKFETFCPQRIRGAMLDELRQLDWAPRLVRSRAKQYQKAQECQAENGNGDPEMTVKQIARQLKITLEEAERIKDSAQKPFVHFVSIIQERGREGEAIPIGLIRLNDIADPKSVRPEDEIRDNSDFEELVSFLPDLEQIVLKLHFRDGYEMAKIGRILSMSESRISQITSGAVQRIKDYLFL